MIVAAAAVNWGAVSGVGAVIVSLALGVLSARNARRTGEGSVAKDIATAGQLARDQLVDEVERLGRVVDTQQARLDASDAQIAALRAAARADREKCDADLASLRRELGQETAYTTRLTAALRDAGLAIPERGEA